MSDPPRRRILVGRWALVLATLFLIGSAGYCQIFSRFQPYDDEGLILINARQVAAGHALYDDVHALYGPWFFLTTTALHRLGLLPLTHDAIRLLTLMHWLGVSLLAAALVGRLTGNLLLLTVSLLLVFAYQGPLANEPGHPQTWLHLLLFALPLLALLPRDRLAPAGVGALLACLFLTKINVGLYAGIAVAHAQAAALPGAGARWYRRLLALAMLALPAILMRRDLDQAWVAGYVLTATLAILAVVRWPEGRAADGSWREVLGTGGAFGLTAAVIVLVTLTQGTSRAGLVHGVFTQHLLLPFTLSFRGDWHLGAAVAGPAAAGIYLLLRQRRPDAAAALLNVLRLGFFLVVLVYGFREQPGILLSVALPFAWLGLAAADEDPRGCRARRLLVTLAVLQALVAYPVAGSQRIGATVLLLPLAVLCAGDAMRAWPQAAARRGVSAESYRFIGAGLVAVLLIVQVQRTYHAALHYGSLLPLRLPGAERLRLPEEYVMVYRWLAVNLRAHADGFYTQPGMNSLYPWTGLEPPTRWNTTTWMVIFPAERQEEIVAELRALPRVGAVVSEPWTDFWLAGKPRPDGPLLRYLRDEFQTVGAVQGFEFRVGRERPPPALLGCVRVLARPLGATSWTAEVVLPPLSGGVGKLTVVELPAGRVVASTAAGEAALLESAPTGNGAHQLRFSPAPPLRPASALGLRIHDAAGNWLTTLPFLD